MKKSPNMRLQDLIGLLNRHYPQHLAEDWDNVGLQVGDLNQKISKVMVALEPTLATVETAIKQHCQALVTHHPLIFKPLKKISPTDHTGQIIFSAIRSNLAIISIHTNLDHAADGLNDWLATTLQLTGAKPLLPPQAGAFLKLVVYVPADHAETVAQALFKAGAGQVGNYDHCSFSGSGIGTFRAQEGCNPYIGTIGSDHHQEESRLETIVPRTVLKRVVANMLKSHPYEEVAYDLIPVENIAENVGLGRIGSLPQPCTINEFAEKCKQQLNCQALRVVATSAQLAQEKASVNKIAVCSGSGAMVIREAARQGADLLVTGDVKYHEALNAKELGLAVIDAGHFATEHIMAGYLADKLTTLSRQQAWPLEYITAPDEIDPFTLI